MQILACDHCGAPHAVRFHVIVDRSLDAAGSVSDRGEVVDLCSKCQAEALQEVLASLDHQRAQEWVKKWKGSRAR